MTFSTVTGTRNIWHLHGGCLGLAIVACMTLFSTKGIAYAGDRAACSKTTVEDTYGPEYAAHAVTFLGDIKRAVQADDAKMFAKLVRYPVRVYEGNRAVSIRSSVELLKRFHSIVTTGVKRSVLKQDSTCLFANGDGVMIGHGEVWFEVLPSGKAQIVTINTNNYVK